MTPLPATFVRGAMGCAAIMLAACAPSIERTDPPPRDAQVSYRTEAPEGEGRYRLKPGEAASQVEPAPDNPLPDYPSQWRDAGLPPLELSALVSIDTTGTPSAVEVFAPEPACGACAEDFRSGLQQTLRGWRFRPLQISGWIDGPDTDGDGEADSVTRATVETRPYSLRLRFRYEIRDGRASVTAAPN